jgi:hypothetical protein
MIWDSWKASVNINSLSALQYHPLETANAISDYFDNLFTPHVLREENHERRMEPRAQALLEAERVGYCDLQKSVKSLKLRKACRISFSPNEYVRRFPRRYLVQHTHLFKHWFLSWYFRTSWDVAQVFTWSKPGKTILHFTHLFNRSFRPSRFRIFFGKQMKFTKTRQGPFIFAQNLDQLASCLVQAKFFQKFFLK